MTSKITWHLEKRKLSCLKPYHKNPRQLSKDQEAELVYSLDVFGVIDKPFINLDNTLIGGHQRIHALKKLGYKEIEVNVPDRNLSEREVEELNIRHNKNTGEWDYDCLANEFEVEDLLQWGFKEEELGGISVVDEDAVVKEDSREEEKCPVCNQKIKKGD